MPTAREWVGLAPALRETWKDVTTSLWLVPAVEVLAAIVLSTISIWLDAAHGPWLRDAIPIVFGGTPEGARTLLSVVAGSVISVVAVIFSVTIIALQQAATQYTPRVLRSFMLHRGNQIVLGTYLATFAFALLVLRQVRSASGTESAFTPSLSIFATIVLVLVDLALLVYFIHHTSESLQASFVIGAIRFEMAGALERAFPDPFTGESVPSFEEALAATRSLRGGEACVVRASRDGYLRCIDHEAFMRALPDDVVLAVVPVCVGEYLVKDSVIARLWTGGHVAEGQGERLMAAFVIRETRTTSDDPLFGIRQLSDIAIKALSPGINDPTTAEEAIDALGGVNAVLMDRAMPASLVRREGGGSVVRRVRTFEELIDESFGQIRRAARHEPHVLARLVDVFALLGDRARAAARAIPLRRQLDELLVAARADDDTPGDRRRLVSHAAAALDALDSPPSERASGFGLRPA